MFINVKNSTIVQEIEVETKDLKYEDGKMLIKCVPHNIRILGDELNKVKGFVLNYGDGFPRILTDYFGVEHDFFLGDVIFENTMK